MRVVISEDILTLVTEGAKKLNIELPPEAKAAFRAYYDFLEKRGQDLNLTAISGLQDVVRLHFLDSIALLNITCFKDAKVIDIGSGAGFPGIPLKIAEPSVDMTLLEATGKKVRFLEEILSILNIDATCVNARAEEAAHEPEQREKYDIAVSRAVARLNVLCELCLPFVKVDGLFIAMKSIDSSDETIEAQNAVTITGARIEKSVDYTIPGTTITHRAVLIKKERTTPEKYPRRFARIQKSPL